MKHLWKSLEIVSSALGAPAIPNRIRVVSMVTHPILDRDEFWKLFLPHRSNDPMYAGKPGEGYLGKLGFKIEPAGKIRVFAMVDA
jgi:hypothetical protein